MCNVWDIEGTVLIPGDHECVVKLDKDEEQRCRLAAELSTPDKGDLVVVTIDGDEFIIIENITKKEPMEEM